MSDATAAAPTLIVIKGPHGDHIEIQPEHFAGSHYEAQGYAEVAEGLPPQPDFYTANGIEPGPEQTDAAKAEHAAKIAQSNAEYEAAHPYAFNDLGDKIARELDAAGPGETADAVAARIRAMVDAHFASLNAPAAIATEAPPA